MAAVAGFVSKQPQILIILMNQIFFLVLPLNSIEADEETDNGDGREREGEGEGETDSKAGVEVESEAEAEREPEGEAEHTITHLKEAEPMPDVSHKPPGAHQEGAEM